MMRNLLSNIIKKNKTDPVVDNDEKFIKAYKKCKKYTMTSKEKMYALYKSVEYVIDAGISGDFVECGVWKGGSAMLMAMALLDRYESNRKIYLYDTFEGMSQPTEYDYKLNGNENAFYQWSTKQKEKHNNWCYAPLQEVKNNISLTKYPKNNLIYVKGKVEQTLKKTKPSKISILRLDTDWYESTKHELIHLFPLLEKNGVLILDDYGYWAGSKKAVDEYFSNKAILLNRIQGDARVGIKI